MKKRILVGFIMNGRAGGIDKYLLNFLEQMHSEKVQIDFLTTKIDLFLQKELCQYGSSLYEVASLRHPLRQYKQISALIRKNGYATVYLNISTAVNCVAALAAKKCRVEKRILHSHSTGNDCASLWKRLLLDTFHGICRLWLYRTVNCYLACSKAAGLWLFPRRIVNSPDFSVVNNAIDTPLYVYDLALRQQMRKQLSIQDNMKVIGFVGNFCYQKNLPYLLNIFEDICARRKDYLLMLVGDGIDFDSIKNQASERRLSDGIFFLGRRGDVPALLQAMDIFVLPSRFEGLGIVGVEAQASGLPCIFSDAVPKEVQVTDNCAFLSIREKPQIWVDKILALEGFCRKDQSACIQEHGYDLSMQRKQLEHIIA